MVKNQIIVALDFNNSQQALSLVDNLDPNKCRVKVGKELFTREGPEIVKNLVYKGFDVFLDLKFHDIPNTTANACLAAADLGAWMVNVHVQGGSKMMQTAKEKIINYDIKLIGVTVLTSMDSSDIAEIGINTTPAEQVICLSKLAYNSGLDGVVCSPLEISAIRKNIKGSFGLVTPGIRPVGSLSQDQKRVMTPKKAIDTGSDWLVIGRPITQADNPVAVVDSIYKDINT